MRVLLLSLVITIACEDGGLTRLAPDLKVDPDPITFAETAVGVAREVSVTLSNQGSSELIVTALSIEGTEELSVAAVGQAIAAGESTSIAVVFRPSRLTAVDAALVIESNDPDEPKKSVPILAPRRTGAVLVLCASSEDLDLEERCSEGDLDLDLGLQTVGSDVEVALALKSAGDEAVTVSSVMLEGNPVFSLEPFAGPITLVPSGAKTLAIEYRPTEVHEASARIAIASSAGARNVVLAAASRPRALCLDPPVLEFDAVPVGASSTKRVRATACGGSAIDLLSAEITEGSGFSVTSLVEPVHLLPTEGLAFEIEVRYQPTVEGNAAGELLVQSSGGDARVALVAESQICDLDVTPTAIDLMPGAGRNILIENRGNRPCMLTNVLLTPQSDPRFLLQLPAIPRELAPGASETVGVTWFGEEESDGTVEIHFTADGQSDLRTVALRAIGVMRGPCQLSVSPTSIEFGVVALDVEEARTIVIVNDGESECRLSGAALVAGGSARFTFHLEGGLVVAPMDLVAGVVRFSSDVVGGESATLRIDTIDVPLSATTDGPRLCVTPPRIDFGAANGVAPVNVSSCGTQPLIVNALDFAPVEPEIALASSPALPLTLAPGAATAIDVAYASTDAVGDSTELVIGSNGGEGRVLVTGGAIVPEVCENGLDEDGDTFIDEDCVLGPAIGRAVTLGAGRLFVWGDEHVKYGNYGALPAPFWRGTFEWLSCSDCAGGPRTRIGEHRVSLNPLMRAEAAALGLSITQIGSLDAATLATVDVVLVVANSASPAPDLRPWIDQGGALMIMSVGVGEGECTDSLDPFVAPFPLRYDCTDPNPWGPVSRFYPHPLSFELQPEAAPFVNGRFVSEDPDTHSTVIAVP